MESGLVKSSHHAVFDEAWYMQPKRPPAAQLLYDLGLEAEDCMVSEVGPDVSLTHAMYPLVFIYDGFQIKVGGPSPIVTAIASPTMYRTTRACDSGGCTHCLATGTGC